MMRRTAPKAWGRVTTGCLNGLSLMRHPNLSRTAFDSSSSFHRTTITSARHRSFHFYLNLEDPEESRRHVEEDLERLADENKKDGTAYLHAMLNLALSAYQAEDYIQARKLAEMTHEKSLQHNKNSSFIFLTAKTCARCCEQLAAVYEAHVARMEQDAQRTSALAPKASVVFSAQRTIRKLREDAVRYDGIAQRVYNRPGMAYMRDGNGYSTGAAGHSHRSRGSTAWTEDTTQVDEEYEQQYGQRWQNRRTRPEHVEMKRHHQSVSGGRWKVPK